MSSGLSAICVESEFVSRKSLNHSAELVPMIVAVVCVIYRV